MTASTTAVGTAHVRNLTRHFGGPPVLDCLSLDIAQGEFVALLGASGSGKTTLLRTLAGLDPVPDDAVVALPQPVAVAFQQPLLLPWKTVWQNVAIGLPDDVRPSDARPGNARPGNARPGNARPGDARPGDPRARAAAALAEVGLSHRLDAWPATLSGGEAQRAALARALVRAPGLLLLDEPFAALDALTRLRMHSLVLDLWACHRPATLLVTHDVDEAVALADRVLVLDRGRIVLDAANPASRPRDRSTPAFAVLRARLLQALGVTEPHHGEHA